MPKENNQVYALSRHYDAISNVIISPIKAQNPFTGQGANSNGIWDTGATIQAGLTSLTTLSISSQR